MSESGVYSLYACLLCYKKFLIKMIKNLHERSILLTLLMILAVVSLHAQNEFSVQKTYIEQGTYGTLELVLKNGENEFYGFQANVTLPNGLIFAKKADGSPIISLTDRAPQKGEYQVISNLVGGVLHFGAYSNTLPQLPITGNAGVLVKIGVIATDNYKGGNVNITGIKFVSKQDTNVKITDSQSPIGVLPSSIALHPANITLFLNAEGLNTATPEVTYLPDYETTYKAIEKWYSSDESVATVAPDGTIRAVSNGTTTITAETINGKTASCQVKVITLAEGINLAPDEITMERGFTEAFKGLLYPATVSNTDILWESANLSIASIGNEKKPISGTDLEGKGFRGETAQITAQNIGTTTIKVSSGGFEAISNVRVVASANEIIINPVPDLHIGQITQLIYSVKPDDATEKELTWTSSDPSIATVDAMGKVTPLAFGQTIITATCPTLTGSISGSVVITVVPVAVESISLTNTELIMRLGYTTDLTALVRPDDATDKRVIWSSNDESIASVSQIDQNDDKHVLISANALGTTVIYVSSVSDPTIIAECQVTVVNEDDLIAVTNITLNYSELNLIEGDNFPLTAIITPEFATDKSVTWRSDNREIATVSEYGVVTAVKTGVTTIYASTSNGLTAECKVTVSPKVIDVTSISLTNTELLMRVGKTTDLTALVRPDDATDKRVTWASDNESIASIGNISQIDQNGQNTALITANSVGETFILVTSVSNPSVTAQCKVTVMNEEDIIAVSSISLNKTELTLETGSLFNLIATILPENTTDKTVTWKSSDRAIATVSSDGVVTAVSPGTAIIYASSSNGLTAECKVNVVAELVPVGSISLTNTELLMRLGRTADLNAIVRPDNATDKRVTWTATNESIASIVQTDHNGENSALIAANSVGETTILVTSVYDPSVIAECKVTVMNESDIIAVSNISLNRTELFLTEDDTFDLIATILPEDATDKTVTWKSSDRAIATASQEGVVTAISPGVAIVYASSSNGLTAECKVTVTPRVIPVESISLTNTELLMRKGHSTDLLAIVRPDNATDKTVTWQSDDESIVSVNFSDVNAIVTANEIGTAIITVTSVSNPSVTAQCHVRVVNEGDITAVTDIMLNETEISILEGDTFNLIATIMPRDATDKTVTWKSSDRSVATASQEGVVTGVSPGTAIVYASSSNGLTVQCKVNVLPRIVPVESISLTNTELLMRKGYSTDLLAIVRPDNATDKRLTWQSDDESIVSVKFSDVNAILYANEIGNAIITVTSVSNPSVTAQCHVRVVNEGDIIPVTDIILNRTELDLTEGETFNLIATILPEDATDKTVTWKSSDRAVATASQEGLVTAISVGTAIVYASSSNGLTAECKVNVKPRPWTPKQLLRKGDGTTCTFVVMMGIPDSELEPLGYTYAVGYTDMDGQSGIIAETPLRYCHTSPDIYNRPDLDFWTFVYFINDEGKMVNSNLRHLDGREEICYDASVYLNHTRGEGIHDLEGDNWIKVTPTGCRISTNITDGLHIAIYSISGVQVYSKSYSGEATVNEDIELNTVSAGQYVVVARCGSTIKSKKIAVR